MSDRGLRVPAVMLLVLAVVAGCSQSPASAPGRPGATAAPAALSVPTPPPPPARVTTTPAVGAVDVNPAAPVSIAVTDGTLSTVTLTGDDARPLAGAPTPDRRSWAPTEPLGYDRTYTWSGTAVGADGAAVPLAGTFRTLAPAKVLNARFAEADGSVLGVGAPVQLEFDGPVTNKAAVQRALSMQLTMPQDGAWAWLPDTAEGSRIHYRPKVYWRSGTVIDVRAALLGVDLGGGTFGATDVTNHLVIGRTQITHADLKERNVTVVRDGKVIMDVPGSFGPDDDPNLVTRNGPHVVTDKEQTKLMSNPRYNYFNVYVRWAVRINNNGEFLHSNPATVNAVGQENITHGCINMNEENAHKYYDNALVGDPVEVTGSPVQLSKADGDIYDWTIPWDTWRSMSAV